MWWIWVAISIATQNSKVRAVQDEEQPLSIAPSQYWAGNDGRWSTFWLNVGTPFQRLQLLPSTSATAGDTLWAVIPQGCTEANPQLQLDGCTKARGGLFQSNLSTTWSQTWSGFGLGNNGLYELTTLEESMLGLSGSAIYGFDTISLGPGIPPIPNQIIAGIATNEFWLGSFGLSPLPFNFSDYNNPVPSLLGTLRNMSLVPSTSWAYTAGAFYKEPPVFGSLTFGGYDAVRMKDVGVSMSFGTDQSRDLLVGVQSITIDRLGSSPLLANGVYMFIDSLVTHIWLPTETCEAFEVEFGLEWDPTQELYLLNSSTHASLQARSPSVTFTLGSSASGGPTTTVVLPYSALDLSVDTSNGARPYFPIKRAQNDSQLTLGRVFLQEAYVIADYDRKNFTVAQAAFPIRSEQNTTAILAPDSVNTTSDSSSGSGNDGRALSVGAEAGIATGAVVGSIALGIGAWLWVRKRRHSKRAREVPPMYDTADSEAEKKDTLQLRPESSLQQVSELHVNETYRRSELSTDEGKRKWKFKPRSLHELPAADVLPVELESPTRRTNQTQ